MKPCFWILPVILLGAGCSTRMVELRYAPSQNVVAVTDAQPVQTVSVTDKRKDDPDWIGAIRGGYGNPLKTLKVKDSVAEQYQRTLIEALKSRNLYQQADAARLRLTVEIQRLDSNYIKNREVNVEARYRLSDAAGATLFENTVKVGNVESASGLGVSANMDSFQAFTEKAIMQSIDRIADDPGLITALRKRTTAK